MRMHKFWRIKEIENLKKKKQDMLFIDNPNMRQYQETTLAVSSRRLLETEEKHLKIKRDKNEWNKTMNICPFIKTYTMLWKCE